MSLQHERRFVLYQKICLEREREKQGKFLWYYFFFCLWEAMHYPETTSFVYVHRERNLIPCTLICNSITLLNILPLFCRDIVYSYGTISFLWCINLVIDFRFLCSPYHFNLISYILGSLHLYLFIIFYLLQLHSFISSICNSTWCRSWYWFHPSYDIWRSALSNLQVASTCFVFTLDMLSYNSKSW